MLYQRKNEKKKQKKMIPSSQSVFRFAKGEPNRFRLRSSQTFALARSILVDRSSCWALKKPSTGLTLASLKFAQRQNLFPSTGRSELLLSEAEHGLNFNSAKALVAPRPILSRMTDQSSCLAPKGLSTGLDKLVAKQPNGQLLALLVLSFAEQEAEQVQQKLHSSSRSNDLVAKQPNKLCSSSVNGTGNPSAPFTNRRFVQAGLAYVYQNSRCRSRFDEQAKVDFRALSRRAQLGRPEATRNRFIVNSYKDGIDPTTDEPLNTEVAMRPLVGVSNQPELGRQLPNKADEQETRTIVITSGKGGVGKTTTTANLGMSIARLGYRVALIDADIGLRNLDLLLGLENRVLYTAMDIFEGDCRLDQALIRDKRLKNLCLLAISKNRQRYNVTRQKMDTLIASISALGYHFILIDCPAGIDIGFIKAISPAQEALIVTTPEITAMRDADRVAGLLEANGIYNAKLLINRVRPDMIQRHDMMSVQDVQDVLGIPLLGAIPEDLNVIISTNRGEPLVLRKKLTLSGIAFENAARRLIGRSDYLIDLKTPYKGLFQKMKTLFFNNQ